MAGICCGVVPEGEASVPIEPSSRPSRRRRLDLLPLKYIADTPAPGNCPKRRKCTDPCYNLNSPRDCENAVENCESSCAEIEVEESEENKQESKRERDSISIEYVNPCLNLKSEESDQSALRYSPKFGVTSVCGRRRDMEDAVSIHPSFWQGEGETHNGVHFFGVFDGHGCSHVAVMCKDRMHEIVKEELNRAIPENLEWRDAMERSFAGIDEEVQRECDGPTNASCRCELQTPRCDAVGSTAVVAVVTSDKIIVSNCGDSRAVLCRNGVAIPLSSDHKPDRPDELLRVEEAGGRVIYWDGPRVLGVLAMSRAIGDSYLKPYVISEPEVTVTDRTAEDECLILASDGLWDVVSNETACGVARMCLRAQKPPSPPGSPGRREMANGSAAESSDMACADASMLLTKLALARHSSDNVSVVVVDLRRDHNKSQD